MMACRRRRRRITRTNCTITWFTLLLLLCSAYPFCSARDTLTYDTPIRDSVGSETLVSAGGKFELGFFPPLSAQSSGLDRRYVGIWYHNMNPRIVVWVANREDQPVAVNSTSTGVFAIQDGNLQVLDDTIGKSYWSTGLETPKSLNLMVRLMDSGNLVLLRDGDDDPLAANNILWQSFRKPTDTFIPGMVMDQSLELTSWRDQDDPRIGDFTFKLDQEGDQFVTLKNSTPYWRSGESGNKFSSLAGMFPPLDDLLSNFSKSTARSRSPNKYNNFTTVTRLDYNYTRMLMSFTGEVQFLTWIKHTEQWNLLWKEPRDRCSVLNACGNFGSCNINNWPLVCKCLPGFKPQFAEQWEAGDFSNGCARESAICSKDTFLSLKMMKVGKPDAQITSEHEIQCRKACLNSCQCQAFSYGAGVNSTSRDTATSLCWTWSSDLNNLEEEYDNGQNLSARVALSSLESTVRDCKPCGTTIIPYPLSTGPDCGDPMYSRFNCSTIIGQLSFVGLTGTFFRVISINPSTQRFVIQTKNCDPMNRVQSQQLNLSPFTVTRWCYVPLGNFSSQVSSGGTNAVEIGWELPLEPACTISADCRGWPHSTCSPASDRKKRCLCNANYQWSGYNLNCTQEGNLQQTPKSQIEEQPRRKVPVSLILIVVAVVTSGIFLACIVCVYIWRRKITKRHDKINRAQLDSERRVQELIDTGEFKEEDEKGIDVPFFDLQSILDATDNFSNANKLGQGGYGPVYKGKFLGDQEIAVKRLSRASGQGLQEFKNEVVLIAKLQHRNLVRLKGYCIKGEEKILLYEYMPNKSLDSFIFDHTKSIFLNWEMRFNIILGIARGLLYLHQDSRLRIIHRDLKTSNILLDEEMNPKISDFGLARIVGGKETESNTNTVVGTYGYMSPEYALDGTFSVKSDVFSFGVVLLEIISGKKNTGFYQSLQTFSLISYAWRLWTEASPLLRKHKTKRQERKASKKQSQSKQALKMVVEDAPKISASEDQAKTETNPKPREEDDEPEEGEIVGDEESASKPSKGIAPQSHALEHSWTFWFDSPAAKSAKTKQEDWGSSIRPIYTFSTVEEFWSIYNNIRHPSKLALGTDFHCFKYKIEPKWEDPVCANGGKWTVTFPKGKSDTSWLYTLLGMIGEQFDHGDEICGAVVNVRNRQEKISIWTKNAINEAAQLSIGKQWKGFLDYNETIGFIFHEDAMRQERSAKNKYVA